MTPAELQAWIRIAGELTALGFTVAGKLKSVMQTFHPDVTDAELDAVVRGTIADAERRLEMARSEAGHVAGPTANGG